MATELKKGDIIEIYGPYGYQQIFRGRYKHWALYVGDGDVVHLGPASLWGFFCGRPCCAGSVTQNVAKVKREKLKDVVGRDEWCINNLLDDQRKPRPIEDILQDAESLVGEIRPLNLPSHNCEHFVLELRYRTSESDQVLKIGDLIAISRSIRLYQHWAVYVGDGDVVHLGSVSDAGFCCLCSSSGNSSNVRSLISKEAKVRRDKLEVAHDGDKYRINNRLDEEHKPRPIKDILNKANSLVGKIIPYDLLTNNCEHFITELRYGKPISQQVETAGWYFVIGIVIIAVIYVVFLIGIQRQNPDYCVMRAILQI